MNYEDTFFKNFDDHLKAVIEPNHEKLSFHFHSRLVYAFVPQDKIQQFIASKKHQVIGQFSSISFNPLIYEIDYQKQKLTFCQAPLGAPAATQLLDWLISYGVKKVIAVGNAGALTDIDENMMLVPNKAIRDEGTSFHYLRPSMIVDLNSDYLKQVQTWLQNLGIRYQNVTTWTTDGFFRETVKKVQDARQLGASTVEMECAALAACAQFRKINFAHFLFTADTLANEFNYDERNWGIDSYLKGMEIATQILIHL